MKVFIVSCILLLANSVSASIKDIKSAIQTNDAIALQSLAKQTNGIEKAFALYHYASIISIEDGQYKETNEALVESLTTVNNYLADSPEDINALALSASVYGWLSQRKAQKLADYGLKSHAMITKALSIDPAHPYANLISGIMKYHTPVSYGGGETPALNALDTAIQSYSLNHYTDWGKEEAYLWRGLVKAKLGQTQAALDDFNAALGIAPDYVRVKALIKQYSE